MQQERTVFQRMVSRTRRLQTVMRYGGGVGVLVALLLLPLDVGAVGSGDLDTSFGGDGTVTTNFGGSSYNYANAVAIQADGKIVVAGYSDTSGNGDFALARYLPTGTLDASFGGTGTVTTNFGSSRYDYASAVAIQADGKIVVAGYSLVSSNGDFALARYLPTGTLDTTFGSTGTVLTDFGSGRFDSASALAIQADGKIVVAGYSDTSGNYDFALARYLPNGTLDASFGGDGKVLTDFGSGSSDGATALALQPNGKIVVVGHSFSTASDTQVLALARYLPTGTLDATFSGDGRALTDVGGASWDYASSVVLQPDGKLVVAGESADGWLGRGFLARYLPTGALDASFGGTGTVLTDFMDASALALQPNGKIVVAGSSSFDTPGDFALARYLPTGALDASFGGTGTVHTDFGSDSEDYAHALAIQPRDGRLVVAGYSYNPPSPTDFALARYHAIACNGVVATRVGTAGNDTLMGTDGPDVIVGFDGHDTIYGLGGNDLLCGNAGNDTLDGGSGNDILYGDSGSDTLHGGTGDDTLRGDAGTDVCDGGAHVSKDTAAGCEQVTGVP